MHVETFRAISQLFVCASDVLDDMNQQALRLKDDSFDDHYDRMLLQFEIVRRLALNNGDLLADDPNMMQVLIMDFGYRHWNWKRETEYLFALTPLQYGRRR